MKLKTNTRAPNFKLPCTDKSFFQLSKIKKKNIILYFYPKDDTPTCTTQACNLRDNYKQLIAAGYAVYGISPDKAKKHQKFIDKYDLPFDLLVDVDHAIADVFGVWGEKTTFGRTYMGIRRTTFVFDTDGTVTEIIEAVKAKDHTNQIMA